MEIQHYIVFLLETVKATCTVDDRTGLYQVLESCLVKWRGFMHEEQASGKEKRNRDRSRSI